MVDAGVDNGNGSSLRAYIAKNSFSDVFETFNDTSVRNEVSQSGLNSLRVIVSTFDLPRFPLNSPL